VNIEKKIFVLEMGITGNHFCRRLCKYILTEAQINRSEDCWCFVTVRLWWLGI
jgi:hypothetical protein